LKSQRSGEELRCEAAASFAEFDATREPEYSDEVRDELKTSTPAAANRTRHETTRRWDFSSISQPPRLLECNEATACLMIRYRSTSINLKNNFAMLYQCDFIGVDWNWQR